MLPDFRIAELKFPLSQSNMSLVRLKLESTCLPQADYPSGMVSTVYFDSQCRSQLGSRLSGDFSRHAFRLRWYHSESQRMRGWFEIKAKRGLWRAKSRWPCDNIEDVLKDPLCLEQCARKYFSHFAMTNLGLAMPLVPVLYTSYFRRRFILPGLNLRCNLDSDISYTSIGRVFRSEPSVDNFAGVFEVKSDRVVIPAPMYFLSDYQLARDGFSKFERGFCCVQAKHYANTSNLIGQGRREDSVRKP